MATRRSTQQTAQATTAPQAAAQSAAPAKAPRTPEPEITLEQYRLAYRQLSRPGWPSFEACMEDHVRRTCLAGIARNLNRVRWQAEPALLSVPRGPALPPTPLPSPPPRAYVSPGPQLGTWARRGVDLKRAAANDRDD